MSDRADLYQRVTDTIIAQLEAGIVPWVQPWKAGATTTLHHTRAYVPGVDRTPDDARPLYRVAKDIGSDLCLLPDAIRNGMDGDS